MSKKEMSSAELTKQLERLIQDKANNQRIFDWVEVCSYNHFYPQLLPHSSLFSL